MTRPAVPVLLITCPALAMLLAFAAALAEPSKPTPAAANKDNPEKAVDPAEEAIRREAEKVVSQIDLEILTDGRWTKAERIEKPLLYYGEPTRNNDRGSLWAWGRKGRPVAMLELWQLVDNRRVWAFAVSNTSGRKVRARHAGAPWWRENESIAELKDIPSAPAPAGQAAQRQRQMKALVQKFTAHEFWDPDNSRYELRRLERPLYTYRDEAGGILEGGLYIITHGTNPEVALFVEARADPKGNGKPVWQFAIGRSSHAELRVEYDGKEVFQSPRAYELSGPYKPYWASSFPRTRAVGPGKE